MKVVRMCMLSNSCQGSFQKNHDNMSVSDLFVWLGLTNKLSNFDFVQKHGQNQFFFYF
jgi:hypothetical protein